MLKFSFKKLPVDESGKAYDSLEAFQASLLVANLGIGEVEAKLIVGAKVVVLEILTLTMEARPAARGVKKPRKAKPAVVDAEKTAA